MAAPRRLRSCHLRCCYNVLNDPPDPETTRLLNLAKRAYGGGDKPGAAALARQILLRRPRDATALQILGVIALQSGDLAAARRHLEASNATAENATTLNMLGVAASQAGDANAARAAFTRAGELGLIDGWRNLATAQAGDASAQIASYQRALVLAPNDATSHAGLAQAYEVRHDLVLARHHANAALATDAQNVVARLTLARVLMREEAFSEAEATATSAFESKSATQEQRISALGLVGDARDRRGDTHGAFQAFSAANRLTMQLHGAWLDATERLYHPQNVQRMSKAVQQAQPRPSAYSCATPTPTFLVGFPRSGTTLLDQILSSHGAILCLEEKEYFGEALGAVLAEPARVYEIGRIDASEAEAVRRGYWERVGNQRNALVVDKFPLNIVVLPLIKQIFPDAKIIFALRDPRDVVLSCFQQRFTINAAMAQFLDLERAGAYYDQIMSLFELCRERLDLDLHEVRYEDVVADLEGAARALCSFLGVSFEASMLDYRKTALSRHIATPSARQVIQPLYNRSVGRWRRYEKELEPVLPVLTPWVERFGYAA